MSFSYLSLVLSSVLPFILDEAAAAGRSPKREGQPEREGPHADRPRHRGRWCEDERQHRSRGRESVWTKLWKTEQNGILHNQ